MRTSRANYWSCSKFARRISTIFGASPKLECGTSKEWRDWKRLARTEHPWVFWFNEELLDMLQDIVNWPNDVLCNLRYYIHNRFVSKTHYCRTGLKPGEWHEFDKRIMHGMFEEFIDFVEIECAWHHCMWSDEARIKYHTPWWRKGWYPIRLFAWRCPEAGLDYLKWETSLTNDYSYLPEEERSSQPEFGVPTHQALAAIEQLALYNWWKFERPARGDVYDVSGWSKYCDEGRTPSQEGDDVWDFLDGDRTDEDRDKSKAALDKLNAVEKQYDDEDTDYMVRLIKARHGLWT